jgi:preprotein translocase subunit SecG
MLYGLLLTLFVIVSFLLILIILIQQSKGSMGIGGLGGQTQMLFGGSGGQDIFQKITWVLAALFMAGSLGLALLTTKSTQTSRYLQGNKSGIRIPASADHKATTDGQTPAA